MKKSLLLFVTVSLFLHKVTGQTKKENAVKKGIAVSAGVHLPLGDFSSTHSFGIATSCSPSRHTYGLLNKKKIAFTYEGGIAYYFGKEEIVSGYTYKYPGYFFINAFGGLLYTPIKKTNIILTAGPALGIYNGNTQFNIGSKLDFSYYISDKISVGPGIILMKEPGADVIWAAAFKATLAL